MTNEILGKITFKVLTVKCYSDKNAFSVLVFRLLQNLQNRKFLDLHLWLSWTQLQIMKGKRKKMILMI